MTTIIKKQTPNGQNLSDGYRYRRAVMRILCHVVENKGAISQDPLYQEILADLGLDYRLISFKLDQIYQRHIRIPA